MGKQSVAKKLEVKVLMDNWVAVPIDLLTKATWNYKTNDNMNQKALDGSLSRWGQVENIQVRELEDGSFEVVNGNHRLDSFAQHPEKYGYIICYNHGKISETEAKAVGIATNEIAFPTNNVQLSKLVADLAIEMSTESILEFLPYTDEEIDGMLRLAEFDWSKFNEGADDTAPPADDKEKFTVKIAFETQSQVTRWKDFIRHLRKDYGDAPSEGYMLYLFSKKVMDGSGSED